MNEIKSCTTDFKDIVFNEPFEGFGDSPDFYVYGFDGKVISAFVYCKECGVATRNCALEATARGMWNRRVEE